MSDREPHADHLVDDRPQDLDRLGRSLEAVVARPAVEDFPDTRYHVFVDLAGPAPTPPPGVPGAPPRRLRLHPLLRALPGRDISQEPGNRGDSAWAGVSGSFKSSPHRRSNKG